MEKHTKLGLAGSLFLTAYIGIAVAMSGKKPAEPTPSLPASPDAPNPSGPKPVVDRGYLPEYENYLSSILTPEILNSNIQSLCGSYPDKRKAILKIFKAMANAESGFDRKNVYNEPLANDTVTGGRAQSLGLLQLSYQDRDINGCSEFKWPESPKYTSPFDPYKNLSCGVKIMTRLLKKGGSFQVAGARYWSTLRSSRDGFKTFKNALNGYMPSCK